MHITPLRQLYHFEAIDPSGRSSTVTYPASSEDEAKAILTSWRYVEPKLLSTADLRGNQRPDVALHRAMKDPIVGPDWLPHLWAISSSAVLIPRQRPDLKIVFAQNDPDFDLAQPHIRITALSNGNARLEVGTRDLLNAIDSDTPELMKQLGWKAPTGRFRRDYTRLFGPGWNITYCLHQAIHALTLATNIGPQSWFALSKVAVSTMEHFADFEHIEAQHRRILRVPPSGIAPGVEVRAAEEPVFHIARPAQPHSAIKADRTPAFATRAGSSPDSPHLPTTRTTVNSTPTQPKESENTAMSEKPSTTESTDNAASDFTALLFIIDRSGSMSAIRDDMVGGLSTLLEEQKVMPGRLSVDIVRFDQDIEFTHKMANPNSVEIAIEPRGKTALHDAIGVGISDFDQRINALPEGEGPTSIQVVVVTDGKENASSEYSAEQVRELITGKQADPRWDFVFLGANQDAVTTGGRLGFRQDASMTFSPRGSEVRRTTRSMSRYMHDRRSGQRQGFTETERSRSTREER
jgi:Mg-chelatase subunit ChlD